MLKKAGWLQMVFFCWVGLAASTADLRLIEAVKREDHALLGSLLRQKADLNATAADGTTALHWAVEYDDAQAVDTLVKAGA